MKYAAYAPGTTGFLLLCLLVFVSLVNLLAFAAFAIDQSRARQGLGRVPQRTLLLLAFLGGLPGAKLAQLMLRHRARPYPFGLVLNLTGLILPVGLAAAMVANDPRPMLDFAESLAAKVMPEAEGSVSKPDLPHRFGPGSGDESRGGLPSG